MRPGSFGAEVLDEFNLTKPEAALIGATTVVLLVVNKVVIRDAQSLWLTVLWLGVLLGRGLIAVKRGWQRRRQGQRFFSMAPPAPMPTRDQRLAAARGEPTRAEAVAAATAALDDEHRTEPAPTRRPPRLHG